MARDLFEGVPPTAPQTPPGAPRDLFAGQPPEVTTPSPAAPEAAPPPTTEAISPEHHILRTIGKDVLAAGIGTAEGLSNMGYGLAQLGDKGINALTQKLFGVNFNLQAPQGTFYLGPAEHLKNTIPAKIGEDVLAPALGIVGGGRALAGLGEAQAFLPKALGYGATAAATTPGGALKRTLAGALGAGGGALEHLFSGLPYMFKGKLASKLEKLHLQQKALGNDFYDEAFKGTEKFASEISDKTQNALENLKEAWGTKTNPVTRAIDVFNKNKTLKNLHGLRSDLSKIQSKLADKALKSGLSGHDLNITQALDDAISNIGGDLESNFLNTTPENYNKYLLAQEHWKNNVIPFRQFASVRKLLSPEREISPRLYTDLSKESVAAEKLRTLLKTNTGAMQLARIMHHRVLGLPLPAYLGLGGGYGLYHLKNLGRHHGIGMGGE